MFAVQHISYNQTNAFTKIVLDYLNGAGSLRDFYDELPTTEGIRATIEKKKHQNIDRETLVRVLREQYQQVTTPPEVQKNIDLLLSPNTFTFCTAHQPNLFTGPLYFVYKILHTIKLAHEFNQHMPGNQFVPVYYMGSEDADFAELNHTYVDGKKIEWKKEQKGAVGRMIVDKTLVQLIDELEGQLINEEHGEEVIGLLRKSYCNGKTIQQATFELLNELYGSYGLVVLIPDHHQLKARMQDVFLNDLFENTSSEIVQQTSEKLGAHYNVQAHPREINLFYLKDDIRERIIRKGNDFLVNNTKLKFTEEEIRTELQHHPERFSPNVILRGLYQETILPNLAFIGGGGEMAYWLQLKDLFHHYGIVYPVLVLRNSFLIVEKKWREKLERTGLNYTEIFHPVDELMKKLVFKNSKHQVALNGNFEKAEVLFEEISRQAGSIDPTLSIHVQALKARSLKNLQELEKKMLRAEKRKFSDQERQIQAIKSVWFPGNGLQERKENFSGFYAKWGRGFIGALYQNSLSLEQEFTLLIES